jgi:uncharacterized protein YqjF (DUF2071 family)
MAQRWNNLLFAHWPVATDTIRALVPSGVEIDRHEGTAWLTVSPFVLSHFRPRGLPPLPGISSFCELNVRTYVTRGGKPGVYFFSLDCESALAVASARTFYHLPYLSASMHMNTTSGGSYDYTSRRADARGGPAEFDATYRPTGPTSSSKPGSLDHWLTERYCLYATDARKAWYRAEIHHAPWPLQPAEADIRVNTMAAAAGVSIAGHPMRLSFARQIDVVIWWPERLNED